MGSRSVPASRFWKELTTILPEIADSEYVAVDFEMTGIEPRRAPKIDRPTIHQIYERAKQATETFNVVQFGITCIRFDPVVNGTKEKRRDGDERPTPRTIKADKRRFDPSQIIQFQRLAIV